MKNDSTNGIWSVTFSSHILEFKGVLILEDGRILGGDENFIYSGRYKIKDTEIKMKVRVKKYNKYLKTLLPNEYILSLHGEVNDNKLQLIGNPDIKKNMEIKAIAFKQSELSLT
ncbi:MAG: hypothetical protein ACI9XC_002678 [Gammaproteobacteria bacterium]|jgi:hypothetical protein